MTFNCGLNHVVIYSNIRKLTPYIDAPMEAYLSSIENTHFYYYTQKKCKTIYSYLRRQ
jgi:hypothetical protein